MLTRHKYCQDLASGGDPNCASTYIRVYSKGNFFNLKLSKRKVFMTFRCAVVEITRIGPFVPAESRRKNCSVPTVSRHKFPL